MGVSYINVRGDDPPPDVAAAVAAVFNAFMEFRTIAMRRQVRSVAKQLATALKALTRITDSHLLHRRFLVLKHDGDAISLRLMATAVPGAGDVDFLIGIPDEHSSAARGLMHEFTMVAFINIIAESLSSAITLDSNYARVAYNTSGIMRYIFKQRRYEIRELDKVAKYIVSLCWLHKSNLTLHYQEMFSRAA